MSNSASNHPVAAFKTVVLLVDDQAIIAAAVHKMLQSQPTWEFHYCNDGTKAVEMALTLKPTVILQDLVMPNIDGFGVIEELRQYPKTREIPIVILTAKSLSTDEEKSLEERIYTVIQKQGLQGEALLKTISSALTQPKTT